MIKRLLILLALLPLPLLSPAQPWDLDACVEYAVSNNADILHRRVQYDIQNEALAETAAKRAPVITIGAQETFHSGNALIMYSVDQNVTMSLTQVAATMEMPLLTGGSLPNSKAAQEYALKSAGENISLSVLNTRIRVAAAYLQLLSNSSQEQIALRQVELCQDQLKKVSILVNEGKRTDADLAEARSSLSSAEHLYTAAKGNSLMARVNLVNLIGLDDDSGFEIQDLGESVEDTPVAPLSALLGDIDAYPSVKSVQYSLKSAEYKEKAARGALRPQLSLFANYNNYLYLPFGYQPPGVGEQLLHNGWAALGLKLSVPILNLSQKRQVTRAGLALDDARITLAQARREISKQLREAYFQTVTARDRYLSALTAETAAKEAYDYLQKMYEAGLTTTYDLDQSRLKWVSASEETVRSKYEYLLRNKILGYYINRD